MEDTDPADTAHGSKRRLGPQSHRRVHPGQTGGSGFAIPRPSLPRSLDSPRDVRPHRPPADASSQAQRRQNTLDDMTDTASLAFLGITIGCARCHNHKFEPIAQSDYFRLQAFFTPAEYRRDLVVLDPANKSQSEKQLKLYLA